MKRKAIMILGFIALFGCDKEEAAPSKKELLTNNNEKAWYITASSPNEPCGSAIDDSWIFKNDGTFEFSHGTITEDEERGCGDFRNLVGTWEFTNGEMGLTIFADHDKDDPTIEINETLLEAEITELTSEKLVLLHEQNGATFTAEFSKR